MKEILISVEDFKRIEEVIAELRAVRTGRDRDNLDRLERELRRARRIPEEERPTDIVALNSEVTVQDLGDGTRETYRLVLPARADVAKNRISVLAPIGAALLGFRRGDRIDWPVPGGVRSLRIEQVVTPSPVAAGKES